MNRCANSNCRHPESEHGGVSGLCYFNGENFNGKGCPCTGFVADRQARALPDPEPAARAEISGRKYDDAKVPTALLPHAAVVEVSKVLAFGAKKYGAWNWAGGMEWSRLIGAAQRHLGAFQDGQDLDEETDLMHLAHAACCLVFLICYQKFGMGRDDRHRLTFSGPRP